jgi:adhesin transport system outer membrane protein
VVSGSSGSSGDNYGLKVKSDQLFNLGTGANLKAIEAKKDLANRKVTKANESTQRKLRSLEQRLNSTRRQSVEARALAERAKRNLDLFQEQYDLGQRQVMDVVGVYETYARQLTMQNEYKYEAARIEIKIAQMLGILADGGDI